MPLVVRFRLTFWNEVIAGGEPLVPEELIG
jgi:hypothetical protein